MILATGTPPSSSLLPCALALVGLGCGALLADELPVALPASRYAALERKSMFAPAPPEAAFQPKASFAGDLFVLGLAQFGDKDFVILINRQTREKFSLVTGDKGPDNLELASVRWAEDPAQSVVTVRRGMDSAVLEFDEAAFQKPVVTSAPAAPKTGVAQPPIPRLPILPYRVIHPIPVNPQGSNPRRLRLPGQ